jgi:hypothetical protein
MFTVYLSCLYVISQPGRPARHLPPRPYQGNHRRNISTGKSYSLSLHIILSRTLSSYACRTSTALWTPLLASRSSAISRRSCVLRSGSIVSQDLEWCLSGTAVPPSNSTSLLAVAYLMKVKLTRLPSISVATPPALLNICTESREVFLSHYTKLVLSPDYPSSVYVSFETDTIFFDSLECSPQGDLAYDLACSPHSDRILRCAIDVQLWEVLRVFRFDSLSEVRLLRNVQTIALVLRRGREGGDDVCLDREMGVVSAAGERRDSLFYAENLRKMLYTGLTRSHWGNGIPSVQLRFL